MFKGIDFSGCVESVYFKEADHLFGQLAVRHKMFDRVLAWFEKNFSA
jgi:dipeptidyl aminopeptidase/acylaminoacyl peptidase